MDGRMDLKPDAIFSFSYFLSPHQLKQAAKLGWEMYSITHVVSVWLTCSINDHMKKQAESFMDSV